MPLCNAPSSPQDLSFKHGPSISVEANFILARLVNNWVSVCLHFQHLTYLACSMPMYLVWASRAEIPETIAYFLLVPIQQVSRIADNHRQSSAKCHAKPFFREKT